MAGANRTEQGSASPRRLREAQSPLSSEAEKRLRAQARAGELAWGGTPIFGGLPSVEYNPDLQGPLALQTATEMRQRDAQVRAVTRILILPIQSTRWYVEEPKGAGSAEREAAELLRQNLFGGMVHSWDDVLREAGLAMYYGVRAPEIVWEERAGLVAVRKLASRNMALVARWLYTEAGELAGYLYRGSRPVGSGATPDSRTGTQQAQVAIPIEKVVHFAYEAENDNPHGLGFWRAMYQPEFIKQATVRIMGIGIERNMLGIPVARMDAGAQEDDRAAILEALMRLRAAEDAAIALPSGWFLEWFESSRSVVDAMPFLHFMDGQIARCALAQFLNLGAQSVGTQSLASEQVKVFLDQCEGNARWMEQTLNAQLFRRWALLNYGSSLRPPVLRHRKIEHRSLQEWAAALTQLVNGRFLTPGLEDEEQVRDLVELSPIPREQLQARRAPGQSQRTPRHEGEGANSGRDEGSAGGSGAGPAGAGDAGR